MLRKCSHHDEELNQVQLSQNGEPIQLLCRKCNLKDKRVISVDEYNSFIEQQTKSKNIVIKDGLKFYKGIIKKLDNSSLNTFIDEQTNSIKIQEDMIIVQDDANKLELEKFSPNTWDLIISTQKKVREEKEQVRKSLVGLLDEKIFHTLLLLQQLRDYKELLQNDFDYFMT